MVIASPARGASPCAWCLLGESRLSCEIRKPNVWLADDSRTASSSDDDVDAGVSTSYLAAVHAANVASIKARNEGYAMGKHTYSVKMNQFGDLTPEEFKANLGLKVDASRPKFNVQDLSHLTIEDGDSVDWRTKNVVTPVKNQGQCGSCWSFSTTGSIEGAHAISTGNLVSLSEQNLMDCSTSYGNQGCNGGLMDNAFQYVIHNGGLDTESSYPYTATGPNTCNYNSANSGATISSYSDIPQGDESSLQAALKSKGPISVAMDASSWQFYSSGVFSGNCGNQPSDLDHGILAVGYDTTSDGSKYYIVKNSWGADWGVSGYIWIGRDNNNQCGIATEASYPIV